MDNIKFRGKTKEGKWIYGYYVRHKDTYICPEPYLHNAYGLIPICEIGGFIKVISKTVGQFIGNLDKNGKEIYEGDIYKTGDNTYLVIWKDCGFYWQKVYDSYLKKNVFDRKITSWLSEIDCKEYEIIGNIHDKEKQWND